MFGITMFWAFFFITIKKDNISEKINKGVGYFRVSQQLMGEYFNIFGNYICKI